MFFFFFILILFTQELHKTSNFEGVVLKLDQWEPSDFVGVVWLHV